MDQITANIIYENLLSQIDSEGYHYQVLTEVTEHKRDYRSITKANGLIRSSN